MAQRFDMQKTWQDYDSDEQIHNKAERIFRLIPADVMSIIDVGCGNGIITNRLATKWDVIGLDSSAEALKYLNCPTILASATQIPVEDRKFDLALSSQMLEHLNQQELIKAISEIKRISHKYILISVPNNEFLDVCHVSCPDCSVVFHAWHHLQSFDDKCIKSLFSPEYSLTQLYSFGPKQKRWIPLLLHWKQSLGQWMNPRDATICPKCGNSCFPQPESNILTRIINGVNKLVCGSKPYWRVYVFRKK
jgi:SAM-dependent methyltransferase